MHKPSTQHSHKPHLPTESHEATQAMHTTQEARRQPQEGPPTVAASKTSNIGKQKQKAQATSRSDTRQGTSSRRSDEIVLRATAGRWNSQPATKQTGKEIRKWSAPLPLPLTHATNAGVQTKVSKNKVEAAQPLVFSLLSRIPGPPPPTHASLHSMDDSNFTSRHF